jgi:flagellar basal body-associated protein FliL
VAKETVDGAAQPKKKKMSKKRKFLIALGVIAGLLVGAWVLVVTPAINKLATEQLQAAGLEGAIVEIRADGAKLTLPTLPASVGGGDLMAPTLSLSLVASVLTTSTA